MGIWAWSERRAVLRFGSLGHDEVRSGIRETMARFNNGIRHLLFMARSNFWFLPALMSIAAVLSALFLVEIDLHFVRSGAGTGGSSGMPVESVRVILSTIAGSMITVATLVFSMTLVALTLVSQQLGPRILLQFMDDRPTQIVLGLFLATFLYALIVLVRAGQWSSDFRVTGVAVLAAVILAVLSMGAMIHFIHHVATRIQADVLIAELGLELNAAAASARRANAARHRFDDEAEEAHFTENFVAPSGFGVPAHRSGYLNHVDDAAILACTAAKDVRVQAMVVPGSFVHRGQPVLWIAPAGQAADRPEKARADEIISTLQGGLSIGRRRTPEATVEFEINALVEVALRALSPGINDPHTALACIDRLTDGLLLLLDVEPQNHLVRDEDGRARFLLKLTPFEGHLTAAFEPLRRAAQTSPGTLVKLVSAIRLLQANAKWPRHAAPLDALLDAIRSDAETVLASKVDRDLVIGALDAAVDERWLVTHESPTARATS